MKILIPLISLVLFSCNNASKEKSKVYNETDTHKEHQHNSDVIGIELNNGEKWKVDEAMLLHIRNMESDVFLFPSLRKKNIMHWLYHYNPKLICSPQIVQ